MSNQMIVSTRAFPTSGTQDLGFVYGTSCFSANFFKDTFSAIRNTTIGGELGNYTKLMDEGIESAKERMIENAKALGADGVRSKHRYSANCWRSC